MEMKTGRGKEMTKDVVQRGMVGKGITGEAVLLQRPV